LAAVISDHHEQSEFEIAARYRKANALVPVLRFAQCTPEEVFTMTAEQWELALAASDLKTKKMPSEKTKALIAKMLGQPTEEENDNDR
jgi:hypothetical protein